MAQSKPVLTYFNFLGRGECVRLTLHVGGTEFEDKRIPWDEWPKVKPTQTLRTLPALTHEGVTFTQSVAGIMYAGKLGKLVPTEPLKVAKVMEILGSTEDLFVFVAQSVAASDEERPGVIAKLLEFGKLWAEGIDRIVAANGKPGFTVGDSLTVADLQMFCVVNIAKSKEIPYIPADIYDSFKGLMSIHDAVAAHPKVKEWLAKRPKDSGLPPALQESLSKN